MTVITHDENVLYVKPETDPSQEMPDSIRVAMNYANVIGGTLLNTAPTGYSNESERPGYIFGIVTPS